VAEGVVTKSDREFRQILEGRSDLVRELAMAARALMFDVLPGAVEVVWVPQKSAGYGVGPRKMSDQFAWILPASAHVALAFPAGTRLDDPGGLLQGTGKSIRNVRLSTTDDVRSPALRTLVEQALARLTDPR
jgi:hypothetical protein